MTQLEKLPLELNPACLETPNIDLTPNENSPKQAPCSQKKGQEAEPSTTRTIPSKSSKKNEVKEEQESLSPIFVQQENQKVKLQEPLGFEEREPTEKELCDIIVLIHEILPNCKLDRIIELLYETLIPRASTPENGNPDIYEDRRRPRPTDEIYQNEEDPDVQYFQQNKHLEIYKDLESYQANPRFYEEREIARLFCLKGYGYPTVREYIGDKISPNRYNNVITTIVRLSFRKLECFVMKNGRPEIEVISREELKIIKTPLVNCRNWLNRSMCETFHQFVRLTYKIGTAQPKSELALQLYDLVMEQLQKRSVNFKSYQRRPISDGLNWTEQMETVMIYFYLKHQRLTEVKSAMEIRFPELIQELDIPKLKRRFENAIKLAIKKIIKVRCTISCVDMPDIMIMSEADIRMVLREHEGMEARIRSLQFFVDKESCKTKLSAAINELNAFLQKAQDIKFKSMKKGKEAKFQLDEQGNIMRSSKKRKREKYSSQSQPERQNNHMEQVQPKSSLSTDLSNLPKAVLDVPKEQLKDKRENSHGQKLPEIEEVSDSRKENSEEVFEGPKQDSQESIQT